MAKLKSTGPATVLQADVNGAIYYRVMLGPWASRAPGRAGAGPPDRIRNQVIRGRPSQRLKAGRAKGGHLPQLCAQDWPRSGALTAQAKTPFCGQILRGSLHAMRFIAGTLLAAALAASAALAQQPPTTPVSAPDRDDAARCRSAEHQRAVRLHPRWRHRPAALLQARRRADDPGFDVEADALLHRVRAHPRRPAQDGGRVHGQRARLAHGRRRHRRLDHVPAAQFEGQRSKTCCAAPIIVSGNDACIVLAEGIAGSEEAFAREATARAQGTWHDAIPHSRTRPGSTIRASA